MNHYSTPKTDLCFTKHRLFILVFLNALNYCGIDVHNFQLLSQEKDMLAVIPHGVMFLVGVIYIDVQITDVDLKNVHFFIYKNI